MSEKEEEEGEMVGEFPAIAITPVSFPATIEQWLGADFPDFLPSPVYLPESLSYRSNRVVIALVENLGLFELTFFRPQFLIKSFEILFMVDAERPFTMPLSQEIITGSREPTTFNLFTDLRRKERSSLLIGRDWFVRVFTGESESIAVNDDLQAFTEAHENINDFALSFVIFSDFEDLYATSGRPPLDISREVVNRSSSWVSLLWEKSLAGTIFLVIGSLGKSGLDYGLMGRLAEWKESSIPIALVAQKPRPE
ncbi:MAG: hypothetical protein Q6362_005880 [Candidatus Wukongarchaeota archaeon]|nr:hypothetical protein [Candidatus Wukongarchaeota archaeon]